MEQVTKTFTQLSNIPFSSAILLISAVLGVFILSWGITRLIWPAVLWITRKTHMKEDNWLAETINPLAFIIAVTLAFTLTGEIKERFNIKTIYTSEVLGIMVYVGLAWLFFRIIDFALERLRLRLSFRKQGARANMLPLLGRTVKAFLGLLILVQLLQNAGVDVGALITGLGIGGLALALAGQKTIENLFGGIMLVMDQPFRVGDFVKVEEGLIGTIEDIGWRSSRIRTLENTLVTIPNASLSEKTIDNYAKRRQILLKTVVGVRYDTSPDQLRYLLVNIRKMLMGHPKVKDDPCRARFVNFNTYSLDIEIFCYINTADYEEYLAVKEDVFLRLIDVVEEAGADFAFPTQTEVQEPYIERDLTPKAKAENNIMHMRANNTIPLPDITDPLRKEWFNVLNYPPEGSILFSEDPTTPPVKEEKETPKPKEPVTKKIRRKKT